jgi:hypothetical protein
MLHTRLRALDTAFNFSQHWQGSPLRATPGGGHTKPFRVSDGVNAPSLAVCSSTSIVWLGCSHPLCWPHSLQAGAKGDSAKADEEGPAVGPRKRQREEEAPEDEDAMKNIMMSRKTRKLYDAIQRKRHAKRAHVEALEKKRLALKAKDDGCS